jgi:hypothetical protein
MGNKKTSRRETGTDYESVKHAAALARNKVWQSLTPEQQLAELDRRLGKGVGAAKQRARLGVKIEAAKRAATRQNNTAEGGDERKTKNKKTASSRRGHEE